MLGGEAGGSLPTVSGPSSWEDVQISQLRGDPRVAVVYFDFYNGAMSTAQCRRLQSAIEQVGQDAHVKAVILLGGPVFYSNGRGCFQSALVPLWQCWWGVGFEDWNKGNLSKFSEYVSSLMVGSGVVPLEADKSIQFVVHQDNLNYAKLWNLSKFMLCKTY